MTKSMKYYWDKLPSVPFTTDQVMKKYPELNYPTLLGVLGKLEIEGKLKVEQAMDIIPLQMTNYYTKTEPGPFTPKTGATCSCRAGIERDNCPNCEGTGKVIDFRAIHAAREERG